MHRAILIVILCWWLGNSGCVWVFNPDEDDDTESRINLCVGMHNHCQKCYTVENRPNRMITESYVCDKCGESNLNDAFVNDELCPGCNPDSPYSEYRYRFR